MFLLISRSDYFAKKKSDFQERKLEQKSQKRTDQEKQGKFHEPKVLIKQETGFSKMNFQHSVWFFNLIRIYFIGVGL